jgi:protein transport protein SEC24
MPIMLEAVMRVRASRGMYWLAIEALFIGQHGNYLTSFTGLRMSAFYGNFFVRSTDLLAMPAVPQDQSYAIEMEIEETLTQPFVVMQTAVLHTTCFGTSSISVVLCVC